MTAKFYLCLLNYESCHEDEWVMGGKVPHILNLKTGCCNLGESVLCAHGWEAGWATDELDGVVKRQVSATTRNWTSSLSCLAHTDHATSKHNISHNV
jgi:hypothetical protein